MWTKMFEVDLERIRELDFLPPDFLGYLTKNFTIHKIEGRNIWAESIHTPALSRGILSGGVAYHTIFTVSDKRFPKQISKIEVFARPSHEAVDAIQLKVEQLVEKEKRCSRVPLFLAHYKGRCITQFYSDGALNTYDFLSMNPSVNELKTIGTQLGCLFAIIHNNGIAHGDPMPVNFIISGRGQHIVVYVIDWDQSSRSSDMMIQLRNAQNDIKGFRAGMIDFLIPKKEGNTLLNEFKKSYNSRIRNGLAKI